MSYCHCGDCRRATGAAVTVFVGFAEQGITFISTRPAAHRTRPDVERLFCRDCGTPVAYRDGRLEDRIYFYLGVMTTPDRYAPTCHAFVSEKLARVELDDTLPRFPCFSQARASR